MERIYDRLIKQHLQHDDLMLFLEGPRQVGKTTSSQTASRYYPQFTYLNWDERDHRDLIIEGSVAIAKQIGLERLQAKKACIVFDEIHKYSKWKSFLKGFYDLYKTKTHIIVTGSSRLNLFRRGGDSLMGRYFLYRMHPLSVAECVRSRLSLNEISQPIEIPAQDFKHLLQFGGYPKPFIKSNHSFSLRWQRLRKQQLIREDIRDATRIQELNQLEILTELLAAQSSQVLVFSNLAKKIRVSVDTIRRWINTLKTFYYCFTIKPWHKNVTRSLIKEPKIFLWDWSLLTDEGARFENFIASHLLKAVHFWTDRGLGDYDLFYIRNLEKQEVDFVVTKNNKPWLLVEAKYSDNQSLSPHLIKFQQILGVKYAFQVCCDMPYIDKSCFDESGPVIVPASTFLSQLV